MHGQTRRLLITPNCCPDFHRNGQPAIGGEHRLTRLRSGGLRNIIPSGNTREACSCVRVDEPTRLSGRCGQIQGMHMRVFLALAVAASSLALSGCAGMAEPNLRQGHYFMAGDKNCKQGKNVSETRIMCFDNKRRFTGYRDAMTEQDMQLYLAGRIQDQIASAQFNQSMQQYIHAAPPTFGQEALQQSQQFQVQSVPSFKPNGGITYTRFGNALIGSNGVTYTYAGSTLIGSDGTKCQSIGQKIICR